MPQRCKSCNTRSLFGGHLDFVAAVSSSGFLKESWLPAPGAPAASSPSRQQVATPLREVGLPRPLDRRTRGRGRPGARARAAHVRSHRELLQLPVAVAGAGMRAEHPPRLAGHRGTSDHSSAAWPRYRAHQTKRAFSRPAACASRMPYPTATPESQGLDSSRLAKLTAWQEQMVADGKVRRTKRPHFSSIRVTVS